MTAIRASASKSPKTRTERVVDGPLDLLERDHLERRERGGRGKAVARGGRTIGLEADGVGIGTGDPEPVGGVAPADEHRLATATREGALGDPDDLEGQDLAVDRGELDGAPQREAQPVGEGLRDDGAAPGIERGERVGPVALDDGQSPVGGEIGTGHRGAHRWRRHGPRPGSWRSG